MGNGGERGMGDELKMADCIIHYDSLDLVMN